MNGLTENVLYAYKYKVAVIVTDNLSCDPFQALKSANVRQFLLFSYKSEQHIRHSPSLTSSRADAGHRAQRSSIIYLVS